VSWFAMMKLAEFEGMRSHAVFIASRVRDSEREKKNKEGKTTYERASPSWIPEDMLSAE